MRIEPKKIMCAIDFSDFTAITLSYGMAMAKEFGSQLSVCHIVPSQMMHFSYSHSHINIENLERIDKEQIANAKIHIQELVNAYDMPVEMIVISGHVADGIGQIAHENNIDMVIAATHGRSGIKRFLIGSVTERLIKTLDCPLLVLPSRQSQSESRADQQFHLKRILVGCDFSPDSKLAFDYGLSLAQEFQAELHLAHVIKPSGPVDAEWEDAMMFQSGDLVRWNMSNQSIPSENTESDREEKKNLLFNRLEKKLTNMIPDECCNWCTPVTVLLEGEPYQELMTYADNQNADLMVLGIRGHSLLEQFIVGSTTDRVIRRTQKALLAVRGEKTITDHE